MSTYTRRMDLIRLFYLATFPLTQPLLWWAGAPLPWRKW